MAEAVQVCYYPLGVFTAERGSDFARATPVTGGHLQLLSHKLVLAKVNTRELPEPEADRGWGFHKGASLYFVLCDV